MHDICIMHNKRRESDLQEKRWKSCCTLNNFVCIDTVVSSSAIIINVLADVICFSLCAKRILEKMEVNY